MVDVERQLIITKRKNWILHVVRGEGMLRQIIEGRLEGCRSKGKKIIMLNELNEGETYMNL